MPMKTHQLREGRLDEEVPQVVTVRVRRRHANCLDRGGHLRRGPCLVDLLEKTTDAVCIQRVERDLDQLSAV